VTEFEDALLYHFFSDFVISTLYPNKKNHFVSCRNFNIHQPTFIMFLALPDYRKFIAEFLLSLLVLCVLRLTKITLKSVGFL